MGLPHGRNADGVAEVREAGRRCKSENQEGFQSCRSELDQSYRGGLGRDRVLMGEKKNRTSA